MRWRKKWRREKRLTISYWDTGEQCKKNIFKWHCRCFFKFTNHLLRLWQLQQIMLLKLIIGFDCLRYNMIYCRLSRAVEARTKTKEREAGRKPPSPEPVIPSRVWIFLFTVGVECLLLIFKVCSLTNKRKVSTVDDIFLMCGDWISTQKCIT